MDFSNADIKRQKRVGIFWCFDLKWGFCGDARAEEKMGGTMTSIASFPSCCRCGQKETMFLITSLELDECAGRGNKTNRIINVTEWSSLTKAFCCLNSMTEELFISSRRTEPSSRYLRWLDNNIFNNNNRKITRKHFRHIHVASWSAIVDSKLSSSRP